MKAKAGDKFTKAARKHRYAGALFPDEPVQPKAPGTKGQWVCITCGDLPQNNWQANTHEEEHPKHKLAWRNFESGKVEEP